MKHIYSIIASAGIVAASGMMLAAGYEARYADNRQKANVEVQISVERLAEISDSQRSFLIEDASENEGAPRKVVESQLTPNDNSVITNPSDIEDIDSYIEYVCGLMNAQYQNIDGGGGIGYNCFNGEGYINHRMNDAFGQDHHIGIGMTQWDWELLTGSANWDKGNYVITVLVWKYCYNIIYRCNLLLENLATKTSLSNNEKFVKAQAHTMRAHAYTKLMQYYAPRWENSNNGSAICAIRELKTDNSDHALISMKEVADIIYKDLDDAISLYNASGVSRKNKWTPDKSVAQGIYARAAMVIHDYAKAKTMAHDAATGYTVMDNDTYLAGFYTDNNDMMWSSDNDPKQIYYWGEFNFQACNGNYTQAWTICDAIDMDLVRKMNPNDIRLKCYLTPDKVDVITNVDSYYNPGEITQSAFWNPNLINLRGDNIEIYSSPTYNNKNKTGGLYDVATNYLNYYMNDVFSGDKDDIKAYRDLPNGFFANYMDVAPTGWIRISANEYATLRSCTFGAQSKFWSNKDYSSGHYPFMRSAEMKLLEAEAAYHTGDEATARNILNQINSMRIEGYNFTGSGSQLLDELRLCRRIELWGEGHNWTDFKRWNLPIQRRAWREGDTNSGNWTSYFAIDTPVDANDGWKIAMPVGHAKQIGAIFDDIYYFLRIGKNSEYSFYSTLACKLVTKVEFDLTPVKGLQLNDIKVESYECATQPQAEITTLSNGDYHVEISTPYDEEMGPLRLLFDFTSDQLMERGIMTAHNISYEMFGQSYPVSDEKVVVTGYEINVEDIEMMEEETYKLPEPLSAVPEGVTYKWGFSEWAIQDNCYTVSEDNVITANKGGWYNYSLEIYDPLIAQSSFQEPSFYIIRDLKISKLPWGDADGSGSVDVADVVALLNYLAGNKPTDFNAKYADANRDGQIDEYDASEIVDIILKQPWASPYYAQRREQAMNDSFRFTVGNLVPEQDGMYSATLYLTASKDYTALQTDLKFPENIWTQDVSPRDSFGNHNIMWRGSSGRTRILIYSMSLDVIPAGEMIPVADVLFSGSVDGSELVLTANSKASDFNGNLDVRNDGDNASVSTIRDDDTYKVLPMKGAISIEAPENTIGYIYDISGRQQAVSKGSYTLPLSEGIYIVRFSGSRKAHKVIVK